MIVFAVPDFDPIVGGTSRQTRLQAEALANRGHEVMVVTRRLDHALARSERVNGLSVVRVGPPGRSTVAEKRALLSLARWFRSHRRTIGVVQIVMWPDAIVAAAAAGLRDRSAVLWAIDGEITHTLAGGSSPLRRARSTASRRLLRPAEHVTLTDRMAAEFAHAGFPVRNTVIPVPVDRAHFRPATTEERRAARTSLGLDGDAFVVVYVGHLQRRKAVDRLVAAVDELHLRIPKLRLLLVGGARGAADDTEDALRVEVTERGLTEVVTFCGIASDPRQYLWAADVLALPSQREGMPNSLLEALAVGIPAIAPASAGGDLVLDVETGLVPPSNEPQALAAAIEKLHGDSAARLRMGAAARARSGRYDVEVIADAYERVYARMVKR